MLNYLWAFMVLAGTLYGMITGNVDKITDFESVYNKFIDFFNMEGLQDFYNAWIEADCKELEKII